jgi:ATP-binding cassette, subfamily B, bacterial
VFGATVLSWLLHGPGRVLERNVALVVRERVSAVLVDKLQSLPLAWHEGSHSGATAHRVQQSSRAIYDFAQSQFVYLQNAVRLVGPVAALALIDPWVGAAALIGLAAISGSIMGFDRAMIRLAAQENDAERRYASALIDAMGNVTSVAALRQARGVAARVAARLQAVYAPVKRAIVVNESKWCAVDVLSQALSCGLLALYAWRAARGLGGQAPVEALTQPTPTLALGQVYMVWEYALQAGGVISAVASQFQTFARQHADYASGDQILDQPASHLAVAAAAPAASSPAADRDWTQLAVAGLEFRHAHTPAGLHEVAATAPWPALCPGGWQRCRQEHPAARAGRPAPAPGRPLAGGRAGAARAP